MKKAVLLDGFCGAGGATKGYQRAGFYVVGVDINPQPDYCGDEFVQADFMTFTLDGYDAIHASPPCQAYSSLKVLHPSAAESYPDLLVDVIDRLRATGKPFVVENVEGAPFPPGLFRIRLCGSSFGLRVRRHRWFATNVLMLQPECNHKAQTSRLVGVYGASDGTYGDGFKHPGYKRGPRQVTTIEAREVMEMPWAVRRQGLTQAIPPAYTEFIGARLLEEISAIPLDGDTRHTR